MNMKMMMMAMIGLMYVHTYVRTLIYTQYLNRQPCSFWVKNLEGHKVMLPVSQDKIWINSKFSHAFNT